MWGNCTAKSFLGTFDSARRLQTEATSLRSWKKTHQWLKQIRINMIFYLHFFFFSIISSSTNKILLNEFMSNCIDTMSVGNVFRWQITVMINSFFCCATLCPTHHVGHIDCVVFVTAVYDLWLLISVYNNDYESDQFKGRQESVCVSQCQHGYVQMSVSLIFTGRHTQTRPVLLLTL